MHAQTVYQEFGQIVVREKASNFNNKNSVEKATIRQTEKRHLAYPNVQNFPRQVAILLEAFVCRKV